MEPLLWERWDEVDALLAALLDLPAAERMAEARRRIPDDAPLRDLVLRLVARLGEDPSRLEEPLRSVLGEVFGDATDEEVDPLPGTVLGHYVVGDRLARGGMATVYAAERADGSYQQRVALKVLRRGLDTEDLIQRFRTERQILSSLAHPNIARLLDGGALQDGRPYLVMELVEGAPITSYADVSSLPVRERLTLFLGVADAVQAAHRRLIVHRDLKPSNILVAGDGTVRLLDFGIAKLLDGTPGRTEVDARLLTPAYAAPEQLDGGVITAATDVFQLGLLLRELVLGVPPVTAPGGGDAPISTRASRLAERVVTGCPPPSDRAARRATTPSRLAHQLRGDLELVIDKALRHDPEHRYASAGELAADLRRFLDGRPVTAHPVSAGYRTRKFVERHRWSVGTAVLALLSLAGYAVTLTVQSRRLAAERVRVEREAAKASSVTAFLVDLFHAADPDRGGGPEAPVRELLAEGATRVREEGVEDPVVRAAILSAIGHSYLKMGLYQEARRELAAAEAAHAAAPDADPAGHAEVVSLLAQLDRPIDPKAAVTRFAEARGIAERGLGPAHPMVASILVEESIALASLSPGDSAVDRMRARAVAILRDARGDVRDELANALAVSARGKPSEIAIPRMREALELRRAVHPERHSAVAASLSDLALALEPTDPQASDTLLDQAVAILRGIHGRRGTLLLTTMNNLAALRRDQGNYHAAEPLYREVLALRQELYPEQQMPLAYTRYGLGVVLLETARPAEAAEHLRIAHAILAAEVPTSPLVAVARSALGAARMGQGDYPGAEVDLLEAWRAVRGTALRHAEQERMVRRIVALYRAWGRDADAQRYDAELDVLRSRGDASG